MGAMTKKKAVSGMEYISWSGNAEVGSGGYILLQWHARGTDLARSALSPKDVDVSIFHCWLQLYLMLKVLLIIESNCLLHMAFPSWPTSLLLQESNLK